MLWRLVKTVTETKNCYRDMSKMLWKDVKTVTETSQSCYRDVPKHILLKIIEGPLLSIITLMHFV